MAKKKGISKAFSKALAEGRSPATAAGARKAKAAAKKWCMKCRTRHLMTTPHDEKPRRQPVTLRDLVREADAAGCTLEVSLGPVQKIAPVQGRQIIFGSRAGGKGIVVEVMITTDGEYVFELSQDGKVMGTAKVADHLAIQK